jgi:HSP20 family protein
MTEFPVWRFRSPTEEVEKMRRQMDQWLEGFANVARQGAQAGVFPLVNLTEDADRYFVRAELPGVSGDHLDIQATGKSLAIAGERKIAVSEGVQYHRRERESGKFSRIIALPREIDADKVEARLDNGILTVMIPKAETAKPRQISVN